MRRSVVALVTIALGVVACTGRPAGTQPAGPATPPPSRAAPTSPAPGGTPRGASLSERGFPLGDLAIEPRGGEPLRLQVEIADTPERRALGLMGVADLADDRGMAFVVAEPTTMPFWMRNTLIPLDIAFWDQAGRIVDVQQMEPCPASEADCPLYHPSSPWVGAIEVNLGLLGRSGVKVGDPVRLERR